MYDICSLRAKILDLWGKFDWTLILHLLVFYFLGLFTLMPPTMSGGKRAPFLLIFFLSIVSVAADGTAGVSSSLDSDWLSWSVLFGDFDVVLLEVFFTACE